MNAAQGKSRRTARVLLHAALVIASAGLVCACTEPELPDLGPPADGGSLNSSPAPAQPAH